MTEWKLFEQHVPEPAQYLIGRAWMSLESQPGFAQRAQLVVDLVRHAGPVASISDLGCGDGALLARLRDALAPAAVPMWGYELGAADVAHGQACGLDVRFADIVGDQLLRYGELAIASEVAEHIADPEGFLRGIGSKLLIVSSPSAETGSWHNEIHAWAWDLNGFADLVCRAGWTATRHVECDAGLNTFAGVTGKQKFQAILAVR
jgi:hypothetical protein